MKRLVSVLAMAGAAAACNGEPAGKRAEPSATASATAPATPAPTETDTVDDAAEPGGDAVASADATVSGAREVADETDDFLFAYSYPVQAGRIAGLAALLNRRLDRQRSELARESAEARRAARADGFPYNKHSYSAEWKIVSDLPGWLSLSADIATYGGGAHGNAGVESLVWDKQRARAMDPIELFATPAALEEAVGEPFCEALDRERAKRRGEPVREDSEDSFDKCPPIDELQVLVGSSNRRTFNRLTVYAGPYVAGPYAEGAYSIDLPVTRAVRAAVKPEYQASFAARN